MKLLFTSTTRIPRGGLHVFTDVAAEDALLVEISIVLALDRKSSVPVPFVFA